MSDERYLVATPIEHKGGYSILKPPTPVGYWVLYPGGTYTTKFSMYARPTNEQIKNTEQLLGWKWEEA